LVNGGAVKNCFSDFELQGEHDLANEQDHIHAPAHTWNVEFEQNRSTYALQLRAEYLDLGRPSITLAGNQRKVTVSR